MSACSPQDTESEYLKDTKHGNIMDSLKAGAAAAVGGINSLTSGVLGTDASRREREQTGQEGTEFTTRPWTPQQAISPQQKQIHKEGTDYIKEQIQNRETGATQGVPQQVDGSRKKAPWTPESTANQNVEPVTSPQTHATVEDVPSADTGFNASANRGLPPTAYLPGQKEYGLPEAAGSREVDPATTNSGLSFMHPAEDLDRTQESVSQEPQGRREKDWDSEGKGCVEEDVEHESSSKPEHPEAIPTAGGQRLGWKHWGESKKID